MVLMDLVITSDQDIASRHVLGIVCGQLEVKADSVFMLPTGSTPLRLYGLLAEAVSLGKTSFSRASTFNLDEYLGIDRNDPQSYYRFMWDNLFGKIDIKKGNVSVPDPNPGNTAEFCREYESRLRDSGIDIAIIGIGENGHVGFNEPGTPFSSETHIAELSSSTISANSRFFRSTKEVPSKAITAGLKTIMAADKIILLAFGKKKALAVKQALEGSVSESVPASILQQHRDVTFVLDKDAASMLKVSNPRPPLIGKVKLYSNFNLPAGKNVVFFSPHPDDAAISAGGLLSALAEKNNVHEMIMTSGYKGVCEDKKISSMRRRENETKREADVLGISTIFVHCDFYENNSGIEISDLQKINALMKKIKPDIIFVPHKSDPHPTHNMARETALISIPKGVEVWEYETPWGLFGHNKFNACFEFSERLMGKKLEAIRMHTSQLERTRFDVAARNIGEMRRIIITEQILDYGEQPIKTQPYLELFNITRS
jgi:glucosamine-6-phosphate deaminase